MLFDLFVRVPLMLLGATLCLGIFLVSIGVL